jgi:hypothetical protein
MSYITLREGTFQIYKLFFALPSTLFIPVRIWSPQNKKREDKSMFIIFPMILGIISAVRSEDRLTCVPDRVVFLT